MKTNWLEEYPKEQPPTFQEICSFIDNPLWLKFTNYLSASYQVKPKFEYSAFSMKAGWNVKISKKVVNHFVPFTLCQDISLL